MAAENCFPEIRVVEPFGRLCWMKTQFLRIGWQHTGNAKRSESVRKRITAFTLRVDPFANGV